MLLIRHYLKVCYLIKNLFSIPATVKVLSLPTNHLFRLKMFSKADFLKEFENKIMFGFLVGLNHHTQVKIELNPPLKIELNPAWYTHKPFPSAFSHSDPSSWPRCSWSIYQ